MRVIIRIRVFAFLILLSVIINRNFEKKIVVRNSGFSWSLNLENWWNGYFDARVAEIDGVPLFQMRFEREATSKMTLYTPVIYHMIWHKSDHMPQLSRNMELNFILTR